MDQNKQRFGTGLICRVLTEHGVPIASNSYHAHKKRAPAARTVHEATIEEAIARSTPILGIRRAPYRVRKVHAALAREGSFDGSPSVLVNAPTELREQLQPLTTMALIRRCAALRPGPIDVVLSAAKHTLRAIAKRWLDLDAEIKTHEQLLTQLTTALAPDLVAAGIGADVATEMLIVVGDNLERVHSEAAFARLCGVAPIPASIAKPQPYDPSLPQPRWPPSSQRRPLPSRRALHPVHQPTQAYLARRTAEGKARQGKQRDHPLPRATSSP